MNESENINLEIINNLIKLTKNKLITWSSKLFTESSNYCYVPANSTISKYYSTIKEKTIELCVLNSIPKYIKLQNIQLFNCSDYVNNLPLITLYNTIVESISSPQTQSKIDFLTDLNLMLNKNTIEKISNHQNNDLCDFIGIDIEKELNIDNTDNVKVSYNKNTISKEKSYPSYINTDKVKVSYPSDI
jgi:hypothetical protein